MSTLTLILACNIYVVTLPLVLQQQSTVSQWTHGLSHSTQATQERNRRTLETHASDCAELCSTKGTMQCNSHLTIVPHLPFQLQPEYTYISKLFKRLDLTVGVGIRHKKGCSSHPGRPQAKEADDNRLGFPELNTDLPGPHPRAQHGQGEPRGGEADGGQFCTASIVLFLFAYFCQC